MSHWLKLVNQTALVTGAGSGIGAAIAKALCQQGCSVVLADKDEHAVKEIAYHCNEIIQRDNDHTEHCALHVACDVRDKTAVNQLVRRADDLATVTSASSSPYASILVNAAGVTKDGLVHKISDTDYDSVLDINLKGTFLTCQAFCEPIRLEPLCHTTGASIINIGSVISRTGNVGQSNYAASKGGVEGLTRALAKEMSFFSNKTIGSEEYHNAEKSVPKGGPHYIRVNAILPGFISTPMSEAVPQHVQDQIKEKIPLKRFGTVEDVANMTLFLASSERSGYVTGECWKCSGMISL